MLKKIAMASSRREMAQRDSVELWETEGASAPCTSCPCPAHPGPIPGTSPVHPIPIPPPSRVDSHRRGWDRRGTRGRPGRGRCWRWSRGPAAPGPGCPGSARWPRAAPAGSTGSSGCCRRSGRAAPIAAGGREEAAGDVPSPERGCPLLRTDPRLGCGGSAGSRGGAAAPWVLGEGLGVLTRAAGPRKRDSSRAETPQEMVCEEPQRGQ